MDAKPDKWQQTRREQGWHGGWPDIAGVDYVLDLLSEAGTVKDAGQAVAALGLTDIAAFAATIQPLTPWEAHTIRALSVAYLDGYNSGKDPLSAPPWSDPTKIDQAALGDKMQSIFERLKATAKRE